MLISRAIFISILFVLSAFSSLSAETGYNFSDHAEADRADLPESGHAETGHAVPDRPDDNNRQDRYILIHLDSASSHYIRSEMEAGNLPNLEKTFRDHGFIKDVITYFPSKTPTVISSLREGIPIENSTLVSWAGNDRVTGEVFTGPNTFMQMMLNKPRISVTNLLYGIPGLDWLAGAALSNLPDLLDDYKVLEFYWYAVDTYGHFYGEEHYLNKLRIFDRQFGRMVNRLDEDVNIIIYADHGMTFGEGVDTNEEIEKAVGDQITTASYPNVYVKNPLQNEELAKKILTQSNIDFTFFRSGDNVVSGFHKDGIMHFHGDDDGLWYSYEGNDPLGYFARGYSGETLSSTEWLEFTHDMVYPATPVQIHNLMSNPGSGDILTLLDETKYSQTKYSRRGNHGGFTYRDVTVPLLLRGPKLEFLYDRETLWLQNLFHEIHNVEFGSTPSRDRHYLNSWYNLRTDQSHLQLSFSPYYRWRIGAEASLAPSYDPFGTFDPDRFQAWGKFDLLRSYLTRFWAGAGIDIQDGDIRPMAFIRHEFRYRRFTARTTLSTAGNHAFAVEFRAAPHLSVQVVNFNSAGLRVEF